MNKLQTITRLLLKDNTSDYKKNLYKNKKQTVLLP